MEKHGLAALVVALAPLLLAGCGRPALRGAVPLAGDGQSSWVYVETRDADSNGIWWCSAPDPQAAPRCVKARMVSPAPTAAAPSR